MLTTGLLAAYLITGKLGLRFALINPSASAVWAPSGIALAACLIFGSRIWPAIFIGAFLVNITTYGSVATSIAIAMGNTSEALVAAYLVRRFARGIDVFGLTSDTFRFVFCAAVLSTTVSATIGVTSLCVAGYARWTQYGWIWFTWWMGDGTGDLIVTPFLILWARGPRLLWGREKRAEGALLLATFLLMAVIVFGALSPFGGPEYPNTFLCVPVLLWVAFRFGPRDTATMIFFLSTVAVAGTLAGHGPFSQADKNQALLLVQTFVAVFGTSHLVVAIEVAQRRRLERTRWRLSAVVESSEDAIIAITPDGCITDWNAGAQHLYGFSAVEAVGQRITIIIPPDRVRESAELLERINAGETIAPFETVRRRKDGTPIDISLSISPIKDQEGRIVGASKNARDIAELKRSRDEREALLRSERAARETAESARQAAESANRAKDEFLAMLGHELRNPLNAIALASRLLQTPHNLEKARGIIARQGDHISRLVDDLLDAARVTSGRIVLTRQPLELGALVGECVGTLQETGQLRQHTVKTNLESVWVDGDSARLSQITMNLLGNAAKYTPSGREIEVSVRDGEEATIQIHDQGAGISADILPRVFDLFTRGDFGLQRSPAGLGIGLTLVKRIAELHGGCAEAGSDGPGQGSTFTVRLPRIAAPRLRLPGREHGTNERSTPRRILIIEDNNDGRDGLRELLQQSGHEVYEAVDGPSGVKKALETRPDVILIDLGLPGMDGYEVASRIRSAPGCTAAVLIALTGYGQSEYRAKAEATGFRSYLVKPVDTSELKRLIA
jgi:PAS domain S-box-containing protein